MNKVGFTTTIPVEIIFAAEKVPVDLNNIFITSKSPYKYIEKAEEDGLPRNTCSWIKGIYTAVFENGIDTVIGVIEGDCSNTHALIEIFRAKAKKVIPFAYPYGEKDKVNFLKHQIENLMKEMNVGWNKVKTIIDRIDKIREKLIKLDEYTVNGYVSGFENHLWLVTSTDFNSDYIRYEKELDKFLDEVSNRKPVNKKIRLGFIGVPTIFTDIYQFIEKRDCQIVFNEVQRQFSIPYIEDDYIERFVKYTYPYDIKFRLEDIKREIKNREIDGIIHYVQSFCYRQIQDMIIKEELDVPVITIEGNDPEGIDARTKIRLESFIEMLLSKKG
ncbi:2-hydroxyglutaryl-CoA dehydratase, D-component [Deferribacter desulfuricans SSM1]|uniref:2-hydroxyglutaryl-CoA dehydratase, D-component n=1 Tax=Deferribacter desulfuricans (strain DSM 14783 / JCM 11476 / NBRC 101012 / SSM1) TaxID=639282 RepID=D3PDM9_DEFDS|nr:2-hydroxyacyl-CoA dehydratase [Deferribacter desulfuricans]BAI80702.1 2-hydroxyglutaryl-CoA dehydratase, D-component [Deferribacter desulfuricans SSM1]